MKLKTFFLYLIFLSPLPGGSDTCFSQKVSTLITVEGMMIKGKNLKDILDKYALITITTEVSSSPARLKFCNNEGKSDTSRTAGIVEGD